MRSLFPYPLLSLSLFIMWFLLTQSFAVSTLIFAILVGIIVPFSMKIFNPEKPRIRNVGAIFRLCGVVLRDIVRSNIAVFSIIVGYKRGHRTSDFIEVPLQIQNVYALSALAMIITATPGTLWVQYDAENKNLLLHVLDLVDEEAWIQLIKSRYERLLMEIFE